MSKRTYITKWNPKPSMGRMNFVRRGGPSGTYRGRGRGGGAPQNVLHAVSAGIPCSRKDGSYEEEDEIPKDNEEEDVHWYGTHALSGVERQAPGPSFGRRITSTDDQPGPSRPRYYAAAPPRTVQRVGLFRNAKQSECIQNFDEVFPNLQKNVQRQLNRITAPEEDVEWTRGKVPPQRNQLDVYERNDRRRRAFDDDQEENGGMRQYAGTFGASPARKRLFSRHQQGGFYFGQPTQAVYSYDNRRPMEDVFQGLRAAAAQELRMIAGEDENEGVEQQYDATSSSNSFQHIQDEQNDQQRTIFNEPEMSPAAISHRILSTLPPVYLRNDSLECYDNAAIKILAESIQANHVKNNSLHAGAAAINEQRKVQVMNSFLNHTQFLRRKDLEESHSKVDNEEEDAADGWKASATQTSRGIVHAANHENVFDPNERPSETGKLELLGISAHNSSPVRTPLLEQLYNQTIFMRNIDALTNLGENELNNSPTFLRDVTIADISTNEQSQEYSFGDLNESMPLLMNQLAPAASEQQSSFVAFDSRNFTANISIEEIGKMEGGELSESSEEVEDSDYRAFRREFFPDF